MLCLKMMGHLNFVIFLLIIGVGVNSVNEVKGQGSGNEDPYATVSTFYQVLHFFSKDNPKGLPAVYIPDPLNIPFEYNLTTELGIYDHKVEGLSQMQLYSVSISLNDLRVHAEAKVPHLSLVGQYFWKATTYWTEDSYGVTNITVSDAQLKLGGQITLDSRGVLHARRSDIKLALLYENISVDFQNLHSGYAWMAEQAFPMFMPNLLGWVEDWLYNKFNQNINSSGLRLSFPDSIERFDFLMAQVRSFIYTVGLDPLPLPPLLIGIGSGIYLLCEDVVVEGLSTLHRTHNEHLKYIDNTYLLLFQMGTQEMKVTGRCSIPYVPFMDGPLEILVESIETEIRIHQRTHLRSPPTLRDLKIDLGNIEVRTSTIGTMDYLVEAAANVIPNLFRRSLVEKLEASVWDILQHHLSVLDMCPVVLNQLYQQEKAADRSRYSG